MLLTTQWWPEIQPDVDAEAHKTQGPDDANHTTDGDPLLEVPDAAERGHLHRDEVCQAKTLKTITPIKMKKMADLSLIKLVLGIIIDDELWKQLMLRGWLMQRLSFSNGSYLSPIVPI